MRQQIALADVSRTASDLLEREDELWAL